MKKIRMKRSQKKRSFPTPAFLPGVRGSANWHVRPAEKGETPHTLNRTGGEAEMALPQSDSTDDKFTRLHELLHAAHSPVEEPRPLLRRDGSFLAVEPMMIAEEFRINMVGRHMVGGYEYMPKTSDQNVERAEQLLEAYRASHTGSAAVEFFHWILIVWPYQETSMTDYADVFRQMEQKFIGHLNDAEYHKLRGIAVEACYTIWEVLWEDELMALSNDFVIPSWDSVLKLAAYIQDVDNALNPQRDPGQGESDGEQEPEDSDIEEARRRAEKHTGRPQPGEDEMEKVRGLRRKIERPNFDDGKKVKWAKMDIRKAKMLFRLPKNKLRRSKYKATDEGANPRYPHRLLADGKVFSKKRRVNGGSVLIDDSGSMSWTTRQLKEIILNAPASIIAAYAGYGAKGELVIVGEDGTYADMALPVNHPIGGGNFVDLPALEWLASQSKPRIWVSDMFVVPVEGSYGDALEECLQLCKDYDINVCFTVKEAGEIFRGEKVIHR